MCDPGSRAADTGPDPLDRMLKEKEAHQCGQGEEPPVDKGAEKSAG